MKCLIDRVWQIKNPDNNAGVNKCTHLFMLWNNVSRRKHRWLCNRGCIAFLCNAHNVCAFWVCQPGQKNPLLMWIALPPLVFFSYKSFKIKNYLHEE